MILVIKVLNIKLLNDKFKSKNSEIFKNFFECIKYIFYNIDYETELYDYWEKYFIYCYGDLRKANESANNKKYFEKLSKFYNLDINENNIHNFMYSLQSSYYMLLKLIFLSNCNYKFNLINKEILINIFSGSIIKDITGNEYWNVDFDYSISNLDSYDFLNLIDKLYNNINEYNMTGMDIISISDEFTRLYEVLFPKEIRHSLGEYYTPSWLVKNTLENLEYENKKIIDPTCGSGVFIEGIIDKNTENNIYGFDLNPIAVLTTKLVLSYYFGFKKFNIYENDIMMYPDLITDYNLFTNGYNVYIYGKEFNISNDVFVNATDILKLKELLTNDICLKDIKNDIVKAIYINKLFQRIEAVKLTDFDLVVGNPPWVNWEYLPSVSKELTKKIWINYNLFSQNGKELAFSKEDISLLITYIGIDKLLNTDGTLAFVLRTGSFKSKQNGVGFRNFKIGTKGNNIKVLLVNDFSNVNVFSGAINTTCVAFFKKNSETIYPVPYNYYNMVDGELIKDEMLAIPTTSEKNSLWLNTTKEKMLISSKILGSNSYKARTGVFTGGANAVYWVTIKEKLENGNIIIENYIERAKRKAEKIQTEIESDLVYKLCRGVDLGKKSADSIYIICPHTKDTKMNAIDFKTMKLKYPKTLSYLEHFKLILDERKGFASWEKNNQLTNFYAIQRIGEYTFKKYKVAWKYISKTFDVSILTEDDDKYLGKKLIMPSEKIMYVSFDDLDEAGYIAGILSSKVVKETIESFMTETSISTHVLDKILIYDYDRNNKLHKSISNAYLCNDCEWLNELIIEYYNIII